MDRGGGLHGVRKAELAGWSGSAWGGVR
jgi:hypothetical protein